MKVSSSFNITEESFPEQSSWIGNLLSPLNSAFLNVLAALQGNLSIGDNLIGVVASQAFTTSATYTTGTFTPIRIYWTPGGQNQPSTVMVGRVIVSSAQPMPLTAITAHNWIYDFATSSIVINYVAGLANSSTYTVTFECK